MKYKQSLFASQNEKFPCPFLFKVAIIIVVIFCCCAQVMCKIYVCRLSREKLSHSKREKEKWWGMSEERTCTKENPKIKLNCTRPSFKLNRRQQRRAQASSCFESYIIRTSTHIHIYCHIYTYTHMHSDTHMCSCWPGELLANALEQ